MIPIMLVCVLVWLVLTGSAAAQSWQSAIVHSDGTGGLRYEADAAGNRIPDFSYAGYRNGSVSIPSVAVVDSVSPIPGDNTSNIQTAINRVGARALDGNGFRGALLMKAGRYRVSGTLTLKANGVVLRGAGEGSDSLTNTILYATGDSVGQPTVLVAGGGNGGSNSSAWSGASTANVDITTDTVHIGDRTFEVADAGPFSVGDNIVIVHPKTTAWLRAVAWGGVPNDTGITSYWAGTFLNIIMNRFITSINGNLITIDAPVFTTMVKSLAQSYIYTTTRNNIYSNIGIENLRIDISNPFGQSPTGDGDEAHHAQTAIWLGKIEDAWVRHCTVLHFVTSGIKTSIATRVTIDSCTAIDPISILTGERRYNFATDFASQLVLFSNCSATYARHAFVSNGTTGVSGVVFSQCASEKSFNPSEGHRLWSQGMLYDGYRDFNRSDGPADVALGLYNRGDYGSGHGWASVHSVAWNCTTGTGTIIIQRPPTAQNYAIGCSAGQVTGVKPPAPFSQPAGYVEGTNVPGLNPSSLYDAQRRIRINGTLPVELSAFSATVQDLEVRLQWSTSSEINNAGFEVQRKMADIPSDWRRIGFVRGHGTSNVRHLYEYDDTGLAPARYAYRLKQLDAGGVFKFSSAHEVTVGGLVGEFILDSAYPNPFNPTTRITYQIPSTTDVRLSVFDCLGRRVAVLVDGVQSGGRHQAEWNAEQMSAGIYICRLEISGNSRTTKLVLLK